MFVIRMGGGTFKVIVNVIGEGTGKQILQIFIIRLVQK